jgi:hypothetical protein
MSKKRRSWAVGLLLSAVLDWYKRTAGRYRRFAGIVADNLGTVGPENQFEVERVISVDNPLHASPSCESSLHRSVLLTAVQHVVIDCFVTSYSSFCFSR